MKTREREKNVRRERRNGTQMTCLTSPTTTHTHTSSSRDHFDHFYVWKFFSDLATQLDGVIVIINCKFIRPNIPRQVCSRLVKVTRYNCCRAQTAVLLYCVTCSSRCIVEGEAMLSTGNKQLNYASPVLATSLSTSYYAAVFVIIFFFTWLWSTEEQRLDSLAIVDQFSRCKSIP